MPAIAFIGTITACVMLASGCAAPSADSTGGAGAPAPASGGMMGDGGLSGDVMAGAIAAPETAAIELGQSVESSFGIVVARVLAPVPGWIVVRSTNPPGGVLGSTRVPAGESREVPVTLTALDGAAIQVALHVDWGSTGTLEFDPVRPGRSPDKPVFAGADPVAITAELRGYGIEALANSVLLLVEDQPGARRTLRLRGLLVPGPSWVSVNLLESGLPGKQVGLLSRAAGESQELDVPLDGSPLTDEVVVTVFADRGEIGRFEYTSTDPLGSTDQPWRSAGIVVSQRVRVR